MQHVDVVRRDAVLLLEVGDVEEALLLELEHAPLRREKRKKRWWGWVGGTPRRRSVARPRLEAVSPLQWMSEAPQGQRPVAAAQAAAELS